MNKILKKLGKTYPNSRFDLLIPAEKLELYLVNQGSVKKSVDFFVENKTLSIFVQNFFF